MSTRKRQKIQKDIQRAPMDRKAMRFYKSVLKNYSPSVMARILEAFIK